MASITLKGNPIHTIGDLPGVGSKAPAFSLIRQDLTVGDLAAYKGKRKILNIFPSIDTPVCQASVRAFNKQAADRNDVVVLNISADLPFAQKRFCGAEGIEGAECLSTFRDQDFGRRWGVQITDGPLQALHARAVVVLDENDKVLHSELVPEIAQEPDYAAALAALD